ncbi:MAG TPA: hypothetical protein PK970_05770 [Hyphomicrobiaceae bacterium]|nr:hypothetical protein [Hyphomicrobiaceae bacterium]
MESMLQVVAIAIAAVIAGVGGYAYWARSNRLATDATNARRVERQRILTSNDNRLHPQAPTAKPTGFGRR